MAGPKKSQENYANRVLGRLRELLGKMNRASEKENVKAHDPHFDDKVRAKKSEETDKGVSNAEISGTVKHPRGVHHQFVKDIRTLISEPHQDSAKLTPRQPHHRKKPKS